MTIKSLAISSIFKQMPVGKIFIGQRLEATCYIDNKEYEAVITTNVAKTSESNVRLVETMLNAHINKSDLPEDVRNVVTYFTIEKERPYEIS